MQVDQGPLVVQGDQTDQHHPVRIQMDLLQVTYSNTNQSMMYEGEENLQMHLLVQLNQVHHQYHQHPSFKKQY